MFCKIDLAQLMNCNFTRIGSRLYLPNLNDLVGLEDTQSIFLFSIHWSIFSRKPYLPGQLYRQISGKLEIYTEHLLAKLHPLNFVNTIFYLVI